MAGGGEASDEAQLVVRGAAWLIRVKKGLGGGYGLVIKSVGLFVLEKDSGLKRNL